MTMFRTLAGLTGLAAVTWALAWQASRRSRMCLLVAGIVFLVLAAAAEILPAGWGALLVVMAALVIAFAILSDL